ncbi:MAG: hypothetical protein JJV91_01195 [Desulfosarcina sp.]|nr:hypothetical protein [Desulfobacterales bacterium]
MTDLSFIEIAMPFGLTIAGAILGVIFSYIGIPFYIFPNKRTYTGRACDIQELTGKKKLVGKEIASHNFGKDFRREEFRNYIFRNMVVRRHGKKIKLNGVMEVLEEGGKRWDISLSGTGTYISGGSRYDGFCYIEASLTRDKIHWKALYMMRVLVSGKMTGYWFSEDTINKGRFVFGYISLTPDDDPRK